MANDKIIWPHDSKWMFTVKSFFREACEGSCNLEFPAHAMWRSKAATKARFLAQTAIIGILRERLGQEFGLCFLRNFCSWSQVLDHGTNFTFLDSVHQINLERMSA